MKYLTVCGALLAMGLAVFASPASAQDSDHSDRSDCVNCPISKKYDSTEVIKRTKDVDHSRVIETESVVPSQRLIETNHLIIHENETRHVGTVQHNHTIIEKEVILRKRNVDHMTVNTVVDLVEHKYNTVRKRIVEEREVPGEARELGHCNCERPKALRSYRTVPRYVNSRY
jgi:hypothetical protein